MTRSNSDKKASHLTAKLFSVLLMALPVSGQAQQIVAGMGDSIGEGVQAADAAWQTQIFSYLSIINSMIGGDLALPVIETSLFSVVGNTTDRTRISYDYAASNVSVSGATVSSLINERSNASTPSEIDTEADLVMYPGQYSQLEYIEQVKPVLTICWIGNNDVLSAATSFGALNASQMTSTSAFDQSFTELATRLGALAQNNGRLVVFGNIPNVTDIGFLVDRATAESFTGFPVNLPNGHYTTIIGVLLMILEGDDALITDPGFVLDPSELTQIQDRIQVFNTIIRREAGRTGIPVVDVNARFAEIKASPPVFEGQPVTSSILGGLFSLDGVHPSNLGHALLANEFIRVINEEFNATIPMLSDEILTLYYLSDPSIDKDGDGKATGRLGVGLVETLAFLFGFTGDSNDFRAN